MACTVMAHISYGRLELGGPRTGLERNGHDLDGLRSLLSVQRVHRPESRRTPHTSRPVFFKKKERAGAADLGGEGVRGAAAAAPSALADGSPPSTTPEPVGAADEDEAAAASAGPSSLAWLAAPSALSAAPLSGGPSTSAKLAIGTAIAATGTACPAPMPRVGRATSARDQRRPTSPHDQETG